MMKLFAFLGPLVCSLAFANISRVLETPDFTKTDPRIPNKGAGYCGPTSVSNSLMYLVKKGRLKTILNKTNNTPLTQWELIILLGSNSYMKTASEGGTGATQLVEGIERFFSSHIKDPYTLSYKGIKQVPARFSQGRPLDPPTFADIKKGLAEGAVAWINSGWYKCNNEGSYCDRIGSSWMTVVGFDEKNKTLILHDPNPRSGKQKAQEKVKLSFTQNVQLDISNSHGPISGEGFVVLGEGMHIHERANRALLDGIVVLKL